MSGASVFPISGSFRPDCSGSRVGKNKVLHYAFYVRLPMKTVVKVQLLQDMPTMLLMGTRGHDCASRDLLCHFHGLPIQSAGASF